MGKKAKARPKTKKVTTCEKLKTRIQRTEQTILRRMQQVVEESCDKSRDLSDSSDRILLRTRNTSKKSSSRRDPAFSHANVLNEDAMRDNYRCYCQHFLELPRNLSRPFSNGTSTLERCNEELSFVQAIVWLKSAIVCASQIPVEQLQQIFDRQWDARGNRHREDERTDVEQSRSPVNNDLSVSDGTNLRDTFATSTPLDISNQCVIYTPQRTVSYSRFENTPENKLSMSANDPIQSPVESWTQWTRQSSNNCHITREKEKEVRSSVIPETDVESIVSEEDEEDFDMTYGIPEHQCFEFEKDIGCSVQRGSTSGIEQTNEKIIENKHIFQKNHADVPSECKFILPARNLQSVDPIFDLENNFNRECFISTRNQNYLADKVLESDCSPKSLVITEKAVSQMSNVNPDKYFDILLDSTGNSPALRMSNTVADYPNEDSAYSTSRYDIFNYDTAVEARSIAGNKRLSDTEYYSKLEPCKKKTITYETGKISSSIDGMSTSSNGSLESFISAKDIFQISDGYNDENSEFQIVNYDERINDITFGILEDDAAVAAESIDDKRTPNIEHRYEPRPRNKKTITCEKTTASASMIIQGAVIPNTNIGHRYNLRPRNNRRISLKKEAPFPIIGKPEEYKSGRARNLLEKENENEDKMISADWLNFTLESLCIDRVITESTKVIVSALCDKKTMEEYVMKERRNIYWKDSLEEEAVNTVLNISDIFTKEKKPNICIKVIMTAIVKTLNEVMRENQTSYIETSIWIYRVQIILEFCNSLPICVKVIDYLMTKLKSLQSVLTKNEGKIRKNTYVVINQLHLVFYALNIALGKYRTIIPSDQRSRSVEKIIPHVADLWKLQYIDKELEYIGLDLDAAEKRWLNALENSAVVFTKHYFVQFAEKSLSLVRRADLAI